MLQGAGQDIGIQVGEGEDVLGTEVKELLGQRGRRLRKDDKDGGNWSVGKNGAQVGKGICIGMRMVEDESVVR
jgi:hypothetical protein